MLFPNPSTYMYMMDMFRPRRRTPWDEVTPIGGGTFGQRPWDVGGQESDAGFRGFDSGTGRRGFNRPGMGAGLLALGTSLLEAAPRGDWAGGLARGAAGFGEALTAERERRRREEMEAREEERRRAQETRAESQEERAQNAAELSMERGQAEFDAWKDEQERGKQSRLRTGKTAEQQVAEISEIAAKNPNDLKLQVLARRAAGYAAGEDSDLNKLSLIYDDVINQAFKVPDYQQETEMGIGRSRAEIEAGVRTNPAAVERRANEELAISRGHLGIARERAGQEREGLTDLQAYDRLERKIKEKYDRLVEQHWQATRRRPTPEQDRAWKDQAMKEAMEDMQRSMSRVIRYTNTGDFIEEQ